ncbi:MAG: type II toxin-antitoxin system VapC family toxin [Planctomycetota bacterium]|nr:type II toxin-antitoxin system VapC family toxin [Planctomycetota bacterium]
MIFDTDVLVWVLRGSRSAAAVLEAESDRQVSVVTYMELLKGARDRREARSIQSFLADVGIGVLPLTENIGHRASMYMEEYGLKMGLCVADVLVAATAVESRLALCTANRKHYRLIGDLDVRPFRV